MPEVRIKAEVLPDESGRLTRIRGEVRMRGLPSNGGEVCLYVPYNDPEYGLDRGNGRRLGAFSGKVPRAAFGSGSTKLTPLTPQSATTTGSLPFIEKLSGYDGEAEIALAFESELPRLPAHPKDEWFFDGFFPVPARGCAAEDLERMYHRREAPSRLTLDVTYPAGWTFAGQQAHPPGETAAHVELIGRTVAFGLLKGVTADVVDAGSVRLVVLRRSKEFENVVPTLKEAMANLTKMFGVFPYPTLTVVETTELQRLGLPGLIAINQPRQAVFGVVQREYLNWMHWMAVTQLAMQWYGGVVTAASPDDEWLIEGIADFATLETLQHMPQRFNLFNETSPGKRWLSFDYQQTSEIAASQLVRFAPFARLTNEQHETASPQARQHGNLLVKQAFALRQMRAFAGEQAFYGFLRNLTREYWYRGMTPADFYKFVQRLPSPFAPSVRHQLASFVDEWWTKQGFPDFVLESFDKEELEGGKWRATVTATQDGEIDFPPMVGVKDVAGREYRQRAEKVGDEWRAQLVTQYEPEEATIDPDHETFDSDRFDNSTKWPGVAFFPGNAETFADDGYTVVWLPYPFRRPGEPTSIAVQSALFRYMYGAMFARIEVAPKDKLAAGQIRHHFEMSRFAMHGDLSLDQSYEKDRVVDLSLVRSPIFEGEPHVSLIGRVRRKERVGDLGTIHGSGVLGLAVRPAAQGRDCTYNFSGEIENAPEELAKHFMYERKTAALMLGCQLTPSTSVSVRFFGGSLYHEGKTPQAAYFKPNELKEARVRTDLQAIERVPRIYAVNADMLLPLYLPLPDDTLILTRAMRLRLFSDFGRAPERDVNYRASGVGLQMPLGGDLSGAGALSFTQLSLLVVLRSEAGERVSRKPGVLFDLTGEL